MRKVSQGILRPRTEIQKGGFMDSALKLIFAMLILGFCVGMCVGFAYGEEPTTDLSVGVYAGTMGNSHSECDGDHCLDGKWMTVLTLDYEMLDHKYLTFRPGLAYYHLEYDQSYRETSRDRRQNTTGKTSDLFAATVKGGVILWDTVSPYGLLGFDFVEEMYIYGFGVGVKVYGNWHIEAESINFDNSCDQHSTEYLLGVRYAF